MSALYCKILVILGLAFPMAEVISDTVPHGFYQLFYFYLFLGSLFFLLFIYVDLGRTRARAAVFKRRRWMESLRTTFTTGAFGKSDSGADSASVGGGASGAAGVSGNSGNGGGSVADDDDERLIPRPKQVYGSFYVRMGAVRESRFFKIF